MNATVTATTATTTEERFNAAIAALREEGITVVLNHVGGMDRKPFDKIAWSPNLPTVVFNRDGEPVVGTTNERIGEYAGESVKEIVMYHIGQASEVLEPMKQHFTAAGFDVQSDGPCLVITF